MVTLCSSQKSCFGVEVDEKVMFRFEVFGEVMCKVVAAYGAPVGANKYKTCVIMTCGEVRKLPVVRILPMEIVG